MAMPTKTFGALLIASAAIALSLSASKTAAQERCHPALQDNKKIIAPDADVPPSIRRWSGLYGGIWDDTLCASLAILQVNRDGTIFFQYAWDVAPQWGITLPGSYVDQARITGDTLSFVTNYG